MIYPEITLIAGKNLNTIVTKLITANVPHNVKFKKQRNETKLLFKSFYHTDNKLDTVVKFNEIKKGLTLPFFKSEPVELEWDVASCISQNWSFAYWELGTLDTDVKHWFSTDSKIAITNIEKQILTNIVNNYIFYENELVNLYDKFLIPTFKHPNIQSILCNFSLRKKGHLRMWKHIKATFKLPDSTLVLHPKERFPSTNLYDMIIAFMELCSEENILKSANSKHLICLTKKKQFTESIKLLQHRDKECDQHNEFLTKLMIETLHLYPFLNDLADDIAVKTEYFSTVRNKEMHM